VGKWAESAANALFIGILSVFKSGQKVGRNPEKVGRNPKNSYKLVTKFLKNQNLPRKSGQTPSFCPDFFTKVGRKIGSF